MSSPYLGEIRAVGFTFPPPGWATCNGSLLSISENEALFNLLGTAFGGDGQTTFGLPDLRGRVPVHQGQGSGLSSYTMGQTGGVPTVALTTSQIPSHTHTLACQTAAGSSAAASGNYIAGITYTEKVYATPGTVEAMASAVGTSGGSQPHNNLQPYLAINYIIATEGIYPSQS
jgi:microcystin-dependent protein